MIDESTKQERMEQLVEQYANSFGMARVGLFFFTNFKKHSDFTSFLNTFLSALRRANCRPAYSWTYDSYRNRYSLLLIVNGYFRSDIQDIYEAARRICSFYSTSSVEFVTEIPVTHLSIAQDIISLREIMNEIQFSPAPQQRMLPCHQRTFACSKLF